jgi:serine phosphatase RsbU (regulator of sigma subunit)
VTAACGTIDLAAKTITIANAGHPAPVLAKRDGVLETFGASGPPLGAIAQPTFEAVTVFAERGSLLVLYTDGLTEYDRDPEAGEERLFEAIRGASSRSTKPASSIVEVILGGKAPLDDVAILTAAFLRA